MNTIDQLEINARYEIIGRLFDNTFKPLEMNTFYTLENETIFYDTIKAIYKINLIINHAHLVFDDYNNDIYEINNKCFNRLYDIIANFYGRFSMLKNDNFTLSDNYYNDDVRDCIINAEMRMK
jgi:hypothetical protein